MLIGRTFAYSDTQRYRIGPYYLQLPVNAPLHRPNTNLRDGSMAYHVDGHGANPHVNYEPSSLGGLRGADASYREYRPYVAGQALKATIDRQNNYQQAGERYRTIAQWERDDLITNLVDNLRQCDTHIQGTRLQGEWRSVASFSVEPGESGLTALEEAGDGIDQGAKGRLAPLAAGLTQR